MMFNSKFNIFKQTPYQNGIGTFTHRPFTDAPRDIFKFGGNLNYFILCLTDNLTMTNFFTLPHTFR